ncbi:HTH-type transcriptional regulator MhqR [Ruegeria sp. THAF57]|nr:HTH-type transcriptional regulator MhqR [Ruegeria sp. THAF57]
MGPIRKMLSDAGVTEQQWRVLRVLQEEGPQEPTRIAERACLLLPSLTRILQKLEAKGLIRRRVNPGDKRRQIVEVTAQGERIIQDNIEVMIRLAEEIKDQLGQKRHEALLDLLNELHDL